MAKITKKVVSEVGDAVVESLKQGTRIGKAINKEVIEPVTDAVGGYIDAKREEAAAEKEARITQRAAEIKRNHPKVPSGKALEHARNEEDAGMLDD